MQSLELRFLAPLGMTNFVGEIKCLASLGSYFVFPKFMSFWGCYILKKFRTWTDFEQSEKSIFLIKKALVIPSGARNLEAELSPIPSTFVQ